MNSELHENVMTRDGPIYIAGLDRTGKTTLRSYLASHSRIAIPDVGSNMWTYFYDRFGDLGDPGNLDRCLDAMLRYKHVAFLRPDRERLVRDFREGDHTYPNLFSLFLTHYAEREGKPRWGAQTGLAERYGRQMFAAYPDLHVVHMIRDPRDRYEASLAKWPDGRMRAGGAVARFNYSYSLGHALRREHPERYMFLRFEDLVADTPGTLRAVMEFLGERFEEHMLDLPAAAKFKATLERNESTDTPTLDASFVGRYQNGRIPDSELRFIELFARRAMREFDYTPSTTLGFREAVRHGVSEAPPQLARLATWRTIEEAQQRFPRLVKREFGSRMIVEPTAS